MPIPPLDLHDRPISRRRGGLMFLLAVLGGSVYGLAARVLFGQKSGALAILSVAFIFLVPFAMGFVSNTICWIRGPINGWLRLLVPFLTIVVSLGMSMVLALEGSICIVLWSPIFGALLLFGTGLSEGFFQLLRWSRTPSTTLCVAVALLPFAVGLVEGTEPSAPDIRVNATSIDIRADPGTVWRNVREVRRIGQDEHGTSWTQRMGFPRPIEATLDGEGVGAVRNARFEGEVLFVETITEWEPQRLLAFAIAADTEHIPPTTLDEHVTVGGPYFDVLEGRFQIEPRGEGRVRLHLSSRHRLSTRFNFYSHLWTDFIMRDTQRYILRIIKRRCEQEYGAQSESARGRSERSSLTAAPPNPSVRSCVYRASRIQTTYPSSSSSTS